MDKGDLEDPLKRLSDEAITDLSRSNSWRTMMMMINALTTYGAPRPPTYEL